MRPSLWSLRYPQVCSVILCGLVFLPLVARADVTDPHQILQRMASAYDGITDYTAVFVKRERMDGVLPDLERIELRFQEPFKIYMAWQSPHKGRVAVFVKGENDDKVLISPDGMFNFMRLALEPTNPRITRDSRHSILEAGLSNMIQHIMQEYQRGREQQQIDLRLRGHDRVDGRPAYHLELIYPASRAAGYYAYRGEIWIDQGNFLPTKVLIYDWNNQLCEQYEYHRLRLNPGLGSEAFRLDPSVPEEDRS